MIQKSGIDSIARLVLDTSAFSQMRRGHAEALDLIAAAEVVLVPVTVIGELEAGFELGRRRRENRVALSEFLSEPFVAIYPTTPPVARYYGELFAKLKRAGTPVPVNDIWIAAATLDCGGCVLTFDRHFENFTGVPCRLLEA